jgi:hypothetical protein
MPVIDCNFCPEHNGAAEFDAPTTFPTSPMAYMCARHMAKHGVPDSEHTTRIAGSGPILVLVP